MELIDWLVVVLYCVAMMVIGVLLAKRGNKTLVDFFLSGRSLPWWLLGTSMAATTFSADTPLFVTGLVRGGGVWRNWLWWCFAPAHVLAIFVFAKLWRRSQVMTEAEFSELRYSGKSAAFLRGFKGFFFGIPINCIALGGLSTLAAGKMLEAATGGQLNAFQALGLAATIALFYSVLSGLRGVVVTDLIQFIVAMVGVILLAVFAVDHVGGLGALKEKLDAALGPAHGRLDMLPSFDTKGDFWNSAAGLFVVWIGVLWWAFRNADGGGMLVQRMVAAKDERHAAWGSLWFCIVHYALRAWPWIVVAAVSITIFPLVKGTDDDRAYIDTAIMLLPPGLRGLIVAAFFAAYMSTVDTHLNWGASFITNDLYKRFLKKTATDAHCVGVSQLAMVAITLLAAVVAALAKDLVSMFELIVILQLGTGFAYVARWFWWRANAWTEFAAIMASSLTTLGIVIAEAVAKSVSPAAPPLFSAAGRPLFVTAVTVSLALLVTFLTKPVSDEVLKKFYKRVRPPGPGWGRIRRLVGDTQPAGEFRRDVLGWLVGLIFVMSLNFALGKLLFLEFTHAAILGGVAVIAGILTFRCLRPVR